MSFVQGDRGTLSSSPFEIEGVVKWDIIFRDRESNLDLEGGSSRQVERIAKFPVTKISHLSSLFTAMAQLQDNTETMDLLSDVHMGPTPASSSTPSFGFFQPNPTPVSPVSCASAFQAGPSSGSELGTGHIQKRSETSEDESWPKTSIY